MKPQEGAEPLEPREGDEDEQESPRGVTEVDLTASVIEEASLLDEESSVLGETIPKQPRGADPGLVGGRRAQDEGDGD